MRVAIRTLVLTVSAVLFCSFTQPIHAQGSDKPAALESDIGAGREVSFPVKYNYYFEDNYGNSTDVGLEDGLVTLSKSTFGFQVTKGYKQSFAISPEKILELVEQPQQASRLKVKVAIKSVRGNKEIKQDYYFYGPGASAVEGSSIICADCDDSMDVLYALLAKFRGGQWVRIADAPAAPSDPSGTAHGGGLPTSAQGKYVRKGENTDFLVLGSDGAFLVHQHGEDHGGNYRVEGDMLLATLAGSKRQWTSLLAGDSLHDPDGMVWEKLVESSPALASETPPVLAPTPPPPPAQRQYDDIAPPPPPPAPAPTISMGQTKDQVTAAFGEPQRKAAVGPKEIFFYTDLKMKVTFTNGKVSTIE